MNKIGRNEKCICGSGKKYKKCCLMNKSTIPLMFGMYYKDNIEEGFSLVVNGLDNGNKQIIERLMLLYDGCEKVYQEGQNDVRNKIVTQIQLSSLVKENLELGIKNWNKIQNITTRNRKIYSITIDFSNKDFIQTLGIIMYGIYFLIQQGEIVDDNYNGFYFMNQYKMVS
tara:strand:+ start:774 stop:1283 length:510 start_codon:yes stop_codon:yes gene_type:complete